EALDAEARRPLRARASPRERGAAAQPAALPRARTRGRRARRPEGAARPAVRRASGAQPSDEERGAGGRDHDDDDRAGRAGGRAHFDGSRRRMTAARVSWFVAALLATPAAALAQDAGLPHAADGGLPEAPGGLTPPAATSPFAQVAVEQGHVVVGAGTAS